MIKVSNNYVLIVACALLSILPQCGCQKKQCCPQQFATTQAARMPVQQQSVAQEPVLSDEESLEQFMAMLEEPEQDEMPRDEGGAVTVDAVWSRY